ncbi:hypothetical protein COBT_001352 [Conglomerata obtusa]
MTKKMLNYFENGFLLFLIAALSLSPIIGSQTYDKYLHVFSFMFLILQSCIKARKLLNEKSEFLSKPMLTKSIAFLGAFVVAMFGFNQLNIKEVTGTSKLLSALSLAVFPFSVSDIVAGDYKASDLIVNGICASILTGGAIAWYFGTNIMGLCCLVTLLLKAISGFCTKQKETEHKNFKLLYPIGLALLCVVITLVFYCKEIPLEFPNFDWMPKIDIAS